MPSFPTVISTVLGSSVAVTLCDRKRNTGGMNHFLFPSAGPDDKATAIYGNVAVVTLIRMMLDNGSPPGDLEAQIFGGAYNPGVSPRDVGRDNLMLARLALKQRGIRVVSEDVGGNLGRKVIYDTAQCEIVTLKVELLRDSDWYPYEDDLLR